MNFLLDIKKLLCTIAMFKSISIISLLTLISKNFSNSAILNHITNAPSMSKKHACEFCLKISNIFSLNILTLLAEDQTVLETWKNTVL